MVFAVVDAIGWCKRDAGALLQIRAVLAKSSSNDGDGILFDLLGSVDLPVLERIYSGT